MSSKKNKFSLFKWIAYLIGCVFTCVLICILYFYLSSPIYQFEEPKPFSGKNLYNPYQDMNSDCWKRYNFQVQSRAWGGLTDGRKNSNVLIDSVYRLLGYDFVATSDYQKINFHNGEKESFIPTYEHGYGFFKTHQVCVGAKKVMWRDYPIFQSLSMKQHIIDELDDDCDLLILAHPVLRNGYKVDDFKYLSGYQQIEVLNNQRVSMEHWDMALSNGHRVYIVGNDDAHDVLNIKDVGRRFTMINSPDLKRSNIVAALDKGNSYGMEIYRWPVETLDKKAERFKKIPYLLRADVVQDTFFVEVSAKADSIMFIGQNGTLLKKEKTVSSFYYVIQPNDTYVRTELHFPQRTFIYLNPITRYDETNDRQQIAQIDNQKTWLYRAAYGVVLILIFLIVLSKRKKRENRYYKY